MGFHRLPTYVSTGFGVRHGCSCVSCIGSISRQPDRDLIAMQLSPGHAGQSCAPRSRVDGLTQACSRTAHVLSSAACADTSMPTTIGIRSSQVPHSTTCHSCCRDAPRPALCRARLLTAGRATYHDRCMSGHDMTPRPRQHGHPTAAAPGSGAFHGCVKFAPFCEQWCDIRAWRKLLDEELLVLPRQDALLLCCQLLHAQLVLEQVLVRALTAGKTGKREGTV